MNFFAKVFALATKPSSFGHFAKPTNVTHLIIFRLRFELSIQKAVLAYGRIILPSKASEMLLSTRL